MPHQKPQKLKRKLTQTIEVSYLLFLPETYNPKESKRWPLILFLHGAGERGTNLNSVTVHGPPKIVKKKPDFPFIVVSPQCPRDQVWANEAVLAILDAVIAKHKVDTNRVYLTGLSMGGYATWSLGLNHPERFAAIAPICGGGDLLWIILPSQKRTNFLKKLPVWAFHGARDNLVKREESERMVRALNEIGNAAKLTIYPDAGHDSWTQTYENPELYAWFLDHQLPGAEAREPKKSTGRPRLKAKPGRIRK